MVGEIVGGTLEAVGTVATVGAVAMETPMAAVSALPAVMEVPAVAAQAVETAASVVPEVIETPVAAASSVASGVAGAGSLLGGMAPVVEAANDATTAVEEGFGALSEAGSLVGDVVQSPAVDTAPLIGELHMFLKQNDPAGALEFLAYGKIQQVGSATELGQEAMSLDNALSDLQKMLPEHAQQVLNTVQSTIPENMKNDPEFLERFMKALQEDTKEQTGGDAKQKASDVQARIESSAQKAMQKNEASKLNDRDLEKLKKEAAKKAALLAIREYMNKWRQSVAHDKRLDVRAQKLALRRIDLVEARLLTQESMKWDGVSILKLIALAYVWVQEMQEESLPQPKL